LLRTGNHDGPVYYRFEQWAAETGLRHGVFTRLGGVSQTPWQALNVGSTVGDDPAAVARNRQLMVQALDLDESQVYTVWQVHSADTLVVDHPLTPDQDLIKADGLVTDRPNLALVMRFADCVPVLFFDPVREAIGMAHAGWRGTVIGAAPSVARTMIECLGSRAADIQAAIGPSIGPEDYQVGQEVVEAVGQAFPGQDDLLSPGPDGSPHFNLWEANRRALEALGIDQIEVAGMSTARHVDEFYSHRAEHGRTGRFGAVLCMSD